MGRSLRVADVVLPVLDEREALPWVLARMPAGYDADRRRQRLARRLRASSLGASARRSCPSRSAGFGAACFAGLLAARAEVVCFMDCDASLDPRELPLVAGPVLAGDADLVLGARRAPGRGAAARPGRQPAARAGAAAPHRRAADRHRPDARRAPRGAARARHGRPPLRLAAGDGAARQPAPAGGSPRSPSRYHPRAGARRSPARCGARPARWRMIVTGGTRGIGEAISLALRRWA